MTDVPANLFLTVKSVNERRLAFKLKVGRSDGESLSQSEKHHLNQRLHLHCNTGFVDETGETTLRLIVKPGDPMGDQYSLHIRFMEVIPGATNADLQQCNWNGPHVFTRTIKLHERVMYEGAVEDDEEDEEAGRGTGACGCSIA